MTEDPGIWAKVADWLWAVLAIPVAALWRKADGAATKEELAEATKTFREVTRELYHNAELDRAKCNERFLEGQKEIHKIQIEVLNELHHIRQRK